ncbi:MAG: enoyl-CoA hydratase/isomerase family protein [Calditrichia bacterium]
MPELIQLKRHGDFAWLILNRPEKRNALSPDLVTELIQQLDEIENDRNIKALLITGAGNAFCAGADLAYLKQLSRFSDEENLEDSRRLEQLFKKLYTFPKLTLAAINGPALGGGCGLALCCDFVFAASETAMFGFTEVRIGFVPALILNVLIRKIPQHHLSSLILSGRILSAPEAEAAGMVQRIIDSEKELEKAAEEFIITLLEKNSFTAMMQTKSLYQKLMDESFQKGMEISAQVNADSRKTSDCQKGLTAFLNKKKMNWREM